LERLAPDIFEQPVDSVRQRRVQLLGEVRRLVVDADIVAELLDGVGTFLFSAGDANGELIEAPVDADDDALSLCSEKPGAVPAGSMDR